MPGLFDTLRDIVERVTSLGPSGACGVGFSKDQACSELGQQSVFALHPLSDAETEAVRATQRGVRLLHEGRTEESLHKLHDARQLAPKSHEACSNLGCAYHMSGDDRTSLYWYHQAHCLGPRDETAVLALALLEQRRGQVEEAQKLLTNFLSDVDSSHIGALKQLAGLHKQQNHWSQAGGVFHRLIAIDPGSSEWPAQLQMCLDQLPLKGERGEMISPPAGAMGLFARAFSFSEPILRSAVPVNSTEASNAKFKRDSADNAALHGPVPSMPALGRGSGVSPGCEGPSTPSAVAGAGAGAGGSFAMTPPSAASRGRSDAAPAGFPPIEEEATNGIGPAAMDESPASSSSWAVTQSFRMGAEGEEDRVAKIARVLDRSQVGSVATAVEQLNKGAVRCPEGFTIVFSNSSRAYYLLYRLDKKDLAYTKFKQSIEQAFGTAAVQLQEARRLRESGRSDAALVVYEKVLQIDGKNADAILGVVNCQCDLDSVDNALQAGRQLVALRPEDAEANLRLAELLFAAGCGAEVEPYLKRATSDPKSSRPPLQHRTLCVTAELALATDDFAKALSSAAEAVRVDSSPRSLIVLGCARLRIAEYPAALRALTAALDACSGSPSLEAEGLRVRAHVYSAQAHERLRQYPQALVQAQLALDLKPKCGDARVVKAMALRQSGRGAEATAELEAVLQREPQHAAARLQLGYAQLSEGDNGRAAGTLQAAAQGASSTRSVLGSAKVYLAMALDLTAGDHESQKGADQMLKDGLSLHRNLQHVWREVEGTLAAQPVAAVTKLRGICDLDLTSQQARQLLAMLARAAGQSESASSIAGLEPPGADRRGARARASSVPPNRWAPTSPSEVVASTAATPTPAAQAAVVTPAAAVAAPGAQASAQHRHRSMSPAPWGSAVPRAGSVIVARGGSVTPTPVNGAAARGRSMSPAGGVYGVAAAPSPVAAAAPPLQAAAAGGAAQYRAGSQDAREAKQFAAEPAAAGRPSSSKTAAFELGWNEVIRPEQLVFGPELGAGGSCSVYRGSWNGIECAIKKISGVAHMEEMKKEINALRRLRHPRLVRFIGACIQPPLLMVVMEFMPGGSLYDRIFGKLKNPPLTNAQRWPICLQTAEGLAFLHSNRVVHRDLKSLNILLDSASHAKICDFGLAQQMEATHIARKTGGEGGSPRYMAPECFNPSYGKLTEKVDIWAMGCICIEIFASVLPYADCQSVAQLSARILVERRAPDIPATIPLPVAGLVHRCLVFDERVRITASELHAELAKVRGRCG